MFQLISVIKLEKGKFAATILDSDEGLVVCELTTEQLNKLRQMGGQETVDDDGREG